jgi:hypothetical protein
LKKIPHVPLRFAGSHGSQHVGMFNLLLA